MLRSSEFGAIQIHPLRWDRTTWLLAKGTRSFLGNVVGKVSQSRQLASQLCRRGQLPPAAVAKQGKVAGPSFPGDQRDGGAGESLLYKAVFPMTVKVELHKVWPLNED